MFKHKIILALIFSAAILSALALPALAVDYNPGVTVGQYVKYGNFAGFGQGFEDFNNIGFQQFDVTGVSGSVVTLLSTGQYRNGSSVPGDGSVQVWDVAAGTQNGTPDTQGPIIAANLNQEDAIPPPNTYSVNATETRSYLGVSRTVNILSVALFTSDYNTTLSYVYDQSSGMLLETWSETVVQSEPQPVTSGYSYSVIETNIFSAATPNIDQLIQYAIVGVAVLVVIVVVVVLVLNRKRL